MDDTPLARQNDGPPVAPAYRPPTIIHLGHVADLTGGKDVGASDGLTFLGLDIGSV